MSPFTRRQLLKTIAGAGAASLLSPQWLRAAPNTPKTAVKKPNIIFILADDVGLDGVSCYGGDRYPTPNIDALAHGGTRFEYCYATPLCGPSRSELLTGRYPFRTGMTSNGTGEVMKPQNETMLPRVLKPAGYITASVGKWNQLPLEPGDWGFDEYLRFQGSGVYYAGKGASTLTVNGQTSPIPEGRYVPDLMHDFLIDFITRHRNEPFFAYYPMSLVHGKIVRTPDSAPGSRTLYADNIAYMDKLVGKLVAELERLGLRENTLILFTGDNGTAQRPAQKGTVDGQSLSGAKHSMLEGGSRVPLIVNWPARTPAGRVCHDLTDFSDFFPTLSAIAGAKMPTEKPIDGHSFAPQIVGQTGQPREWVYVELMGFRYVATKQWKLNNSGELYDMSRAPFEEKLVSTDNANPQAKVARAHLQAVMNGLVGKDAPVPNAPMPKKGGKKTAAPTKKAARQARRARRAQRRGAMAP